MSLFDHLVLGAKVEGSGSSTHAERCLYLDSFSIVDDILQVEALDRSRPSRDVGGCGGGGGAGDRGRSRVERGRAITEEYISTVVNAIRGGRGKLQVRLGETVGGPETETGKACGALTISGGAR